MRILRQGSNRYRNLIVSKSRADAIPSELQFHLLQHLVEYDLQDGVRWIPRKLRIALPPCLRNAWVEKINSEGRWRITMSGREAIAPMRDFEDNEEADDE